MLKIIGTSHISRESIEEINEAFKDHEFDIVAVELDRSRLLALKSQKGGGVTARNPIALVMSAVQNYLSKKTGITPGTEMLEAVEKAEQHNTKVFLLDQDIAITMSRLKDVSLKEKVKIAGYGLLGLLGKNAVQFDITKVPPEDFIKYILVQFRVMFPGFYRVLIEERNIYMARRIKELDKKYEDVLVVVGAGHKPGIEDLIDQE